VYVQTELSPVPAAWVNVMVCPAKVISPVRCAPVFGAMAKTTSNSLNSSSVGVSSATIHGTSELAVVVHDVTLGRLVSSTPPKPLPPSAIFVNAKGALKVHVLPKVKFNGIENEAPGFVTEKLAAPAVPINACGSVT
jgi:hypothetical protein